MSTRHRCRQWLAKSKSTLVEELRPSKWIGTRRALGRRAGRHQIDSLHYRLRSPPADPKGKTRPEVDLRVIPLLMRNLYTRTDFVDVGCKGEYEKS